MKKLVKRVPIIGPVLRRVYQRPAPKRTFPGSESYWIQRYESGGNSGSGSFNELAAFKAEIINIFVTANRIPTIIEYGCGDGNQLSLSNYPSYTGFDVSPRAVELYRSMFAHDSTKRFRLINEYKGETAQLTLSLDVIYHLIEDAVFHLYMERLFESSEQFVIIYSSDFDQAQKFHEKRRQFTGWVQLNKPMWRLVDHIPNRFPYNADGEGSLSEFYIYEKT